MKALIVKEDGLIYVNEVPERTMWMINNYESTFDKVGYDKALASAKESAILCADQEQAQKFLLANHGKSALIESSLNKPKPGIYPIPDLKWEVKTEHKHFNRYGLKHSYSHQVAILNPPLQ